MQRLITLFIITFLVGCVNTGRIAVIKPNGQILTGSYNATFFSGSFQVSNGKLTCSGNYNSQDYSATITMPVYCNDGNKGFAVVTRQTNYRDGFGKVIFSDGSQADFVFGVAANAF